ncbi:MAG: hypothetical protein LJE88_08685 [Deltaproteobacteria bacterium]|nr:hypothetical protein [Deltaproteobacteria bacterium]
MNRCRETMEMGVPPGNHPALPRDWFRGVQELYVAGTDTRGCAWKDGYIHGHSKLFIECPG